MTKPSGPNAYFFVFMEVVRCGEIGSVTLRSFFKYHPGQIVHVFGLEDDRRSIAEFKDVIFHSLDKPEPQDTIWGNSKLQRYRFTRRARQIAHNFDYGHLGTASLWAHIIQTCPEKFIIHFDSDVIFRAPALDDITSRLQNGYDIVGPPRAYKNNPNKRDDIRSLMDLTQTCFFGFNKDKVPNYSYKTLTKMCQGLYNPDGFDMLDFFDPVARSIMKNDGQIFYLSPDDYGGWGREGTRTNKYPELNAIVDFGNKMSHFSAVGSGMNFYKNGGKIKKVADDYVQYGLEKYAVYMKLFYNKVIDVKYDSKKYAPLFDVKKWY